MKLWNKFAEKHGLPRVRGVETAAGNRTLDDARKTKARLRWPEWCKDDPKGEGMNTFYRVLRAVQTMPFYLGENDRGWTIDLDFLLRNGREWRKLLDRAEARRGQPRDAYEAYFDQEGRTDD